MIIQITYYPENLSVSPHRLLTHMVQYNAFLVVEQSFSIPSGGVFEISFQVVVSNTGELVISLNNTELDYTVVGKSGGGVVVGLCIITTSLGTNSILSINNPSTASPGGLKVDEATGALSLPLSCHLVIKQLR